MEIKSIIETVQSEQYCGCAQQSDELQRLESHLGGRYHLIRVLGKGAQGQVFLSENAQTHQKVAIKQLQIQSVKDWKQYDMFHREAETLQRLDVPGVAKLHETMEFLDIETPMALIIQDYLEGDPLQDYIAQGHRFRIDQIGEILLQLTNILEKLHHSDPPVIHRDLKPSNILIRKEKKDDKCVCLIDFGAVANPQKRNNQSTVAGTVGYMAPEQLVGNCAIQSDYYSLGATALHMLTGIAPSEFPSDGFELHFEEILKNKVPNIPDVLVKFLKSLMAPQIADRPQNASQLIKQMNALIEDMPLTTNSDYLEVYNKYQSVLKSNKRSDRICISFVIIYIIFTFLILTTSLLEVIPVVHGIYNYNLFTGLQPLIILLLFGYIIARLIKPRKRDPQPLKEQLAQFDVIDVHVQKVLPSEEKESANAVIKNKDFGYIYIIEGRIAAIYGNCLHYYYAFNGRAQCGYKVITNDMKHNAIKSGLKLKAGEKVSVEVWTDRVNYRSELKFE